MSKRIRKTCCMTWAVEYYSAMKTESLSSWQQKWYIRVCEFLNNTDAERQAADNFTWERNLTYWAHTSWWQHENIVVTRG